MPSSHTYVSIKMRRAKLPREVLREDVRLRMLNAMCEDDPRLTVEDCEFHRTEKGYTYESMETIQEKYPDAELYFLIGSDNLENYARAFRLVEFLEKYCYAVVDRGDGDLDAILREIPAAWERRDRFCYITAPEGILNISSTLIREKLRYEEGGVEELLHPKVMEIMQTCSELEKTE